jgi:hypothetical protein
LRYSFCNLFAVGRAEEEMQRIFFSTLLCWFKKKGGLLFFCKQKKRRGKESLRELSLFLFLLQTEAENEWGFL